MLELDASLTSGITREIMPGRLDRPPLEDAAAQRLRRASAATLLLQYGPHRWRGMAREEVVYEPAIEWKWLRNRS
jgi:hypothetical protein